jgi:hypothetical protein
MEHIIYFDSGLINRQKITSKWDAQVKPRELAFMISPNWYAVSKEGGALIMNPDYKRDI